MEKYAEAKIQIVSANAAIALKKENALEKLRLLVEKIQNEFEIQEGENIVETRRMYCSETSDVVLSTPAIIALQQFTENKLWQQDKKIHFAVKSMRYEQANDADQYTKTEKSAVLKKSSGFKLNTFEVDAFKELKAKFEGSMPMNK